MTSDPNPLGQRWTEIDRLFTAALERPQAEREAFIIEESGADRDLLSAVRVLLEAADASTGWFEGPSAAARREALEKLGAPGDPPPTQFGDADIVRELGRGGMGTVYLAERQHDGFRQQVAIKVLRRGLDTDDVVARFIRERRILASLTHPGIARLIDGGMTGDGRLYLVMEYVDGEPITAYGDRMRLTIRQRLELFLEVADAVQAAHASLVVHRDLKPSNILVTEGRVKLIDFGIAKLLDASEERTEHTRTGVVLLTPEIASPEQLRGEPVTTATDVYQLGVLLFQLLTGRRPTPPMGLHTAHRDQVDWASTVRPSGVVETEKSVDPARIRSTTPGGLRRLLRGDLDAIALEALHEDPARRYASVERLADDVRRYLDGRGIAARPDTLAYRTRVFLRRHRWVAPAAAALVLATGGYLATLTRHANQLEQERNTAQREAARAQQVQSFLVDLFSSADPYSPADAEWGRTITVVEALDLGTERVQSELQDRPLIGESLLAAISQVYHSLDVLDRALPLREQVLAMQQARAPASADVAESLGHLATLRAATGDMEAARRVHEERLTLAKDLEPPQPAQVARAHIGLAAHLFNIRELGDAEAHLNAALAFEATGTLDVLDLAEVHGSLALVYDARGRYEAAVMSAQKALALQIEAHGADAVSTASARVTLGQLLGQMNHFDEARGHFETGLDTLNRRLGSDHPETLTTLNNLAILHLNAGDLYEAAALQRKLLERIPRAQGGRSMLIGDAYQNLGATLGRMGRLSEAGEMHAQAAAIYRTVFAPDNYRRALPLLSMSNIRLAQGQYLAAEAAAREALPILNAALPAGHYVPALAECRLGRALIGQERNAEAEPFMDRSASSLRESGALPGISHEYRRECLEAAAAFYEARGRQDDAAIARAALAVAQEPD